MEIDLLVSYGPTTTLDAMSSVEIPRSVNEKGLAGPAGSRRVVLVVEDDPDALEAITAILEDAGYEALRAAARRRGRDDRSPRSIPVDQISGCRRPGRGLQGPLFRAGWLRANGGGEADSPRQRRGPRVHPDVRGRGAHPGAAAPSERRPG